MSKLVSIALCTYNGVRYLEQQLDSLLAQTYPHFEIVVSDDCSADSTLEILHRYAQRDSRFRVVEGTENVGLTKNFERVLGLCKGEYIAPCDQDDVWLPNKIERLVERLGNRCLAYCDSLFIDKDGVSLESRMSDVVPMISTTDTVPFVFSNCVSGHAMLFRREILQFAFPVPKVFFYDWWLAIIASAMGGIAFCDEPLVLYRQHDANITDALHRRDQEEMPYVRGSALWYLRETEERLAEVARIPGEQQKFVQKLLRLWRVRERQWLSLRLGFIMFTQRERLYRFRPMKQQELRLLCKDYFWGVRAKRFQDPHGYADDAAT
jgi:glycosyltransferase involved in cell wall biosynthesis